VKQLLDLIISELSSAGDKSKSLAKWKFDLSSEIQDLAYALGLKLMADCNIAHPPPEEKDRKVVSACLVVTLQDSIIKRLLVRAQKWLSGKDIETLHSNWLHNVKGLGGVVD